MRMLSEIGMVAVGGGIGAAARYGVGRLMRSTAPALFPWHTFVINLTGAFAIGLLLAVAARHGWPGWWRPLLAVGVLGGYTTFSTFSLETVELAMRGRYDVAALYAFGSLALGLAGCWLGIVLGRAL